MTRFKTIWLALAAAAVSFSGTAHAIKIEIVIDNDELYSAAKRAFHAGKLEDAAELYAEAITRKALSDMQTVVAHSDLCVTYLFLERFDEAVEQCEISLHLMPNRWETLNNLGTVYLVKGDFSQALAAYERALGMKPGSRILKANKQLTIRRANEAAATLPAARKGPDVPEGEAASSF
ncbi:MAG TPA: tetratricopeptide repeat protein [Sphingomonadales bacterium]|nr:tetratricopeptide repeat protein [Sphingomonadales bacterium]